VPALRPGEPDPFAHPRIRMDYKCGRRGLVFSISVWDVPVIGAGPASSRGGTGCGCETDWPPLFARSDSRLLVMGGDQTALVPIPLLLPPLKS